MKDSLPHGVRGKTLLKRGSADNCQRMSSIRRLCRLPLSLFGFVARRHKHRPPNITQRYVKMTKTIGSFLLLPLLAGAQPARLLPNDISDSIRLQLEMRGVN